MTCWAILGCGYVGRRLAARLLATGNEVVATSRTEEGARALSAALPEVTALRYTLGGDLQDCSQFDRIVISSPPDANAPAAERALARQLRPEQRLIYLSTTGVYASAGGAVVEDDFQLNPGSERSMRRLRVEEALAQEHAETAILRIAGIYGPHRGVHARMRRGDYRLIGAANTLVSRIYVDDLVDAIVLLGCRSKLEHRVFVIADDEPTTTTDHAIGIARRLGLLMPPTVAASEVSPEVLAMLSADRRVVAKRLHDLGWRPTHPSWREGLEAALSAEADRSDP